MKKFVLKLIFLCFVCSSIYAADNTVEERKRSIFLGVDYFDGATEITRDISSAGRSKRDFDHSGVRLKFGVQDLNDIRFQAYIKIEELEDDIPALASSGKIYGFGADALFTFPTSSNFTPYILVGMGSNFAELDDAGVDYSEDILRAFLLRAGLGGLFKLNKHVELQAGYDFHYRSWEDIEFVDPTGTFNIEQHDVSKTYYIGLNFFF